MKTTSLSIGAVLVSLVSVISAAPPENEKAQAAENIPLKIIPIAGDSSALRAPTQPLLERVRAAEVIFVGKLANKVVEGDWARAELVVEEPLHNVKVDQKILVIWRISIDGLPIYDAADGTKGIAILGDKHEGRFWLRDDKFEDVSKLEEVKKLLAQKDEE